MVFQKTILVILITVSALTFSLITHIAQAQSVEFDLPSSDSTNIVEFINRFYTSAAAIAGIAALVMIVIGSIYYVVSRGSQDKQREGKDIITSAVWGIVLLLGAYTILNTVNPELVTLTPPGGKELDITVYMCKPGDERDECTVQEDVDPEGNDCCIPLSRGPGGLTLTACSAKIELCNIEQQTILEGESWTGDVPWCGYNNFFISCEDSWRLAEVTITGPGAYRNWVFYPEELPATEENMRCVVYAFKGRIFWEDAQLLSNTYGRGKTYTDWKNTDRDDLKSCQG